MFHWWLVKRFVLTDRRLLTPPTMMSVIGMALGVASLSVAMGVVSGFELTLKTAIIDVFGDVMVVSKGSREQYLEPIVQKVKAIAPETKTYTPFVTLEGIVVANGKLSGVIIQGFDPKTVEKVLNIGSRVVSGKFSLGSDEGVPRALVGKALAKRYGLKVGETFKVVLPTPSRSNSAEFTPKVMSFVLSGILDLGKVEYDERYVVTDIKSAQDFAGFGENFSGIRIKLDDSNKALEVAKRLQMQLGPAFWTKAWPEVESNLFRAVSFERIAIFIVILTMVVVASFNISSNLFVSVLKRTADISLLRTLGFTQKDIKKIFMMHGMLIGTLGAIGGVTLGLLLCAAFIEIQKHWVIMPAETYKVDHVGVDIRPLEIVGIVVASLLICFMSTYWPARKGAQLDPVEGLRYE
ncbi:MAG: FtsX-like permease family protein [Bdellovibrionota bacterium]